MTTSISLGRDYKKGLLQLALEFGNSLPVDKINSVFGSGAALFNSVEVRFTG